MFGILGSIFLRKIDRKCLFPKENRQKNITKKKQQSKTLIICRSSEGSSSQEQIASESTTPEQPSSTEYPLEKAASEENCSTDNATINSNNNNHIEQGHDGHAKTADQLTKHESSGSTSTVKRQPVVNDIDDMKRAHAKQLIERYFYQLSTGCGNADCTNKYCASSGQFEALTPNQAAARAIQLFSEDAKLCDFPASKTPRIADEPDSSGTPGVNDDTIEDSDFDDIYR